MRCLIGLLLVSQLLGCRPAADIIPDLLNRTYTFTERDYGSVARQVVVEFARKGDVLYGVDKQPGWCCSPSRFWANKTTLVFRGAAVPDPMCALIDCRMSDLYGSECWQIEQLDNAGLVLVSNQKRLVLTAL